MNDFDAKATTWDANPIHAARAHAVAEGIKANVRLAPHMRAFEYGAGTGLLSFALQPHLGQITLADSSSGMLAVLEKKIAAHGIQNMTAMKLDVVTDPLPQARYHLIYTQMTLHHIPDTQKVLRDFYALLENPGYLCVADLDKEDGSFHGPDFSGHNGFDREELQAKAEAIGFQKISFTTVFHMHKGERQPAKSYPIFLMIAEKQGKS